jgi:hypothetical protein
LPTATQRIASQKYMASMLTVVLAAAAFPTGVRAQATIPPVHRAAILVRTLAYHKTSSARTRRSSTIVVLGKAGSAGSTAEAKEMEEAFLKVAGAIPKGGDKLKIKRLDYSSAARFESDLQKLNVKAVYVSEGLDSELRDIQQVTRRMKVLTIGGEDGPVRAGLSLGVYASGGKSRLIVNLTACRAEGASFGPELLRLAEIVR